MAKAAKLTVTQTDGPLFGSTDARRWAVHKGDECLYISKRQMDAWQVFWQIKGDDADRARAEAAPRRRRTPWNKGLQTSSWKGLNRMQRI
jgi:hypothetical protein